MGDVISSTIKGQVPVLSAPEQQLEIMPPNSAVVPSTSRVSNIIDVACGQIPFPYQIFGEFIHLFYNIFTYGISVLFDYESVLRHGIHVLICTVTETQTDVYL
jgi:hypothetical protein